MNQADLPVAASPTISVVLPVYNGERYLAEALDSIFAQTISDFELIAVDDCSTDASGAILADYAARHSNMRVHTNVQNSKLPASLNNGFRLAQGQWFSWTSDDNILDPNMLERLLAATEDGAGDIYYADFRMIDEDGTVGRSIAVGEPEDMVLGNVVGCCFLYRREVDATLGGYDEGLFGVEDYDFWIRAADHGFRLRPVREELYSYRRHDQSLTGTRARDINRMTSAIMEEAINALPASPRRANAYLQLLCRDPYHMNWHLLHRAFRDDPATVLKGWRDIMRWLRSTAWAKRQQA